MFYLWNKYNALCQLCLKKGEDCDWVFSMEVMVMNLCKLWQILKDRETWSAAVHGVAKSQT